VGFTGAITIKLQAQQVLQVTTMTKLQQQLQRTASR
jgi:hypothetical protein